MRRPAKAGDGLLGRQTTQSVVDGSVGVPQATTLTWDSVAHGIGALATAVSPDQVQTAYQYDSYGRANGMTETTRWANLHAGVDVLDEPRAVWNQL